MQTTKLNISYSGLIKIALPISLGTFVQFIVILTDNYFLAAVGMNSLNGAGNSALIYVTLSMFAVGLSSGAQILIARRKGERDKDAAGRVFFNALAIGVVLSLVLLGLMQLMTFGFLDLLVDSQEVHLNMREFLKVRSLGILFYAVSLIFIGFYVGIASTRVLLYTTLITAGVNIVLDWLLIFGNLGFPELGMNGAAWATITAEGASLLFLIAYAKANAETRQYQLFRKIQSLNKKLIQSLLKLSSPIMLQQVLALATWTAFFMIVEKLGEKELLASHVVRSMYMLIFVSAMGIAQTTKTCVSSLIAENRQSELNLVLKRLIILNFGGIVILSHGMWLYPGFIASMFTSDPEALEFIRLSLIYVLPAMLLVCFSSVLLNAIEGSGKTVSAMLVETSAVIIYVITTWYLCVYNPQPIHIVWTSDYIYFGIIALLSWIILRNSAWKTYKI